MAYIKVIEHEEAEGELKKIYDHLVETRGKLAEVHKIQSLNPESITNHMDLYMTIMFGKSPLRRYQREMIAVVVSAANKCLYCIRHHGEALFHFWKDNDRISKLAEDYRKVKLEEVDQEICRYAQALTLNPSSVREKDHVKSLKELGLKDRAILDVALITAYFNFVNRMVLGLGVEIEPDAGKGYKYD